MIELVHENGTVAERWSALPSMIRIPDLGDVHCPSPDWAHGGWRLRSVQPPPPPVPDLEDEKRHLHEQVDAAAEAVRARYITPGVGQALTYLEKKDQAVAVLQMGADAANALSHNGAAEFPTLSASVPVEAPNLYAAAQLVVAKYEQWVALSRVIETTRLAGKKSISNASDVAAARAAYEAITWKV